MHRIALALATACLALLASTGVASAAVFAVNTTNDAVDVAPGNGVCADASGACTLRAAVMEANALPGADDIRVPGGTYPLTLVGANEDGALTGDLDVHSEVSIRGDGPRRTVVDGQQADRVFDLPNRSVAMTGIGIRNGVAPQGGGVRTQVSKLLLRWAALYNNAAPSAGLTLGSGGGIYSYGTSLTLSGVSLFSNR